MFSKLFNTKSLSVSDATRDSWLKVAQHGAKFLLKCKDEQGFFYFSVTRNGTPLTQPHSIFSDCFAAMAFAQYGKAANEEWAKKLAIDSFNNIEKRKLNPKGQYNKSYPGTRSFSSLAVPMIDINLCLEMLEVLPELQIEERIEQDLQLVMRFYDQEHGLLRENISDKKEDMDTFEGRLVNPGHSIECLWFIMDLVTKRAHKNKEAIVEWCCKVMLNTLSHGWDAQYGGLYYFMDIMGKPPQQLEHDRKWCSLRVIRFLICCWVFCYCFS